MSTKSVHPHMSHVMTQVLRSRCSLPSVTFALAHVESTRRLRLTRARAAVQGTGHVARRTGLRTAREKGVLVAGVGVRDTVGPKVRHRASHAPAWRCACATSLPRCCAHLRAILASLTRRADCYARRRCAGTCGRLSCRGLGRLPSQLDSESNGSERDSESALGVVVKIVLSREHERPSFDRMSGSRHFFSSSTSDRTSLWKRASARFA